MLLRDHVNNGGDVPCVNYDLIIKWKPALSSLFDPKCPELAFFWRRETLTGKYGEDSKLIYDLDDQVLLVKDLHFF
ncbi:hypothetical protein EJB05_07276, partial [Eragrostis curvula]